MPKSRANRLRTLAGLALLCVFIPRASATGDGPATTVVPAAEARVRVGEPLTVAMTVRSSKDAAALIRRPRLLLLDEPLSALDAPLREQLRGELRRPLAESDIPVVLVTHERVEAIALADQVVVMEGGVVLQSGPVHEVFSRPADVSVARIVGVETVQRARIVAIHEGLATVAIGKATLLAPAPDASYGEGYACIRAEEVILQRGEGGPSSVRNRLPGRFRSVTPEGPLMRVSLDCGFVLTALVTRPAGEELGLRAGEEVVALIKAPAVHLIPRSPC